MEKAHTLKQSLACVLDTQVELLLLGLLAEEREREYYWGITLRSYIMRKPSRGEMGALVGALGVGAVGGAEIKEGVEQRVSVERRKSAIDILNKLKSIQEKFQNETLQNADYFLPIDRNSRGGSVGNQFTNEDSDRLYKRNQKEYEGDLNTYKYGNTLRGIVDDMDAWIDTPLAPKIITLLENISANREKLHRHAGDVRDVPGLVDDIARIRLDYKKRWDGRDKESL